MRSLILRGFQQNLQITRPNHSDMGAMFDRLQSVILKG
jgi:hypothetical protein